MDLEFEIHIKQKQFREEEVCLRYSNFLLKLKRFTVVLPVEEMSKALW